LMERRELIDNSAAQFGSISLEIVANASQSAHARTLLLFQRKASRE
jgi:hypothetical protein